MKYKTLAICDPETEYVSRFADYLREHGNIPMDVHAFTDPDALLRFMDTHPVEILLLAESFLRDDTSEWPAGTVVILQQDGEIRNTAGFPCADKYRSAREVLQEVMALYGENAKPGFAGDRVLKPACKVIGVYSPVGRCFKTSFALALGQILANEKPTLYLNLEDFSGLGQMLHEHFERDISDLIYMMRQDENDLMSRMAAMVSHISVLDFIPPCICGQELRSVTPEEWHTLLQEIINRSSYEAVILDLGSGTGHLEDLLTECDVIFMPVRNDAFSDAKYSAFESFLKVSGAERVSGKIRPIQMRVTNLPASRDRYFQQIVWSDIGDYARDCIRREGL